MNSIDIQFSTSQQQLINNVKRMLEKTSKIIISIKENSKLNPIGNDDHFILMDIEHTVYLHLKKIKQSENFYESFSIIKNYYEKNKYINSCEKFYLSL